jgi:NADH:ubiquinone oxidoreductase subunit K
MTALALVALGAYGVLTRTDLLRIFIGAALLMSGITLLLVALAGERLRLAASLVILSWIVEAVMLVAIIALFIVLARREKSDTRSLRELRW